MPAPAANLTSLLLFFCTQDWVSFLRSFGQLSLCPVNGTVTGKWRGPHVVGLRTTLNFGDGPDRNKTQTFQAKIHGSQIGLKGENWEYGGPSEQVGLGPASDFTRLVTLGTSVHLSYSCCNTGLIGEDARSEYCPHSLCFDLAVPVPSFFSSVLACSRRP